MGAKIIPFPSKGPVTLTREEREIILMAADEMIAKGGRELLAHALHGVVSDLVTEAGAEEMRHFGLMAASSLAEVLAKIDLLIEADVLRVEHYWSLPLLVHSPAGWKEIKSIWVDRLTAAVIDIESPEMLGEVVQELCRVHREVKSMLLDRIERDRLQGAEDVLEAWREMEGKRIRRRIDEVCQALTTH